MKGIVFTEFLEMVAQRFGDDMVDDMIADSQVPHKGAYTSVGTYPHDEMVALVSSMSSRTGLGMDSLLEIFGHHLFGRFYAHHPQFMDSTPDPLEFLMGIETIVHTDVRKLYPDAQLPGFDTHRISANQIVMHYSSMHNFSSLAAGLLKGCAEHYRCNLKVERSEPRQIPSGVAVDFTVTRDV
jgi:Haem-NO-binding